MTSKKINLYEDLKNKIENGTYQKEDFLPSESAFIEQYHCTRYSLRNAIARLSSQGYVQSIHGKGVQIIYSPNTTSKFILGGIASFREFATQNNMTFRTHVKTFAEMEVDDRIAALTSFPIGEEIYFTERIRYINDLPLIIDRNYFRKQFTPGLTKAIAEDSIYAYLEKTLHMKIGIIQRQLSVEHASQSEQAVLQLKDINCVFRISSNTYSDKGNNLNPYR